MHWRTTIPAGDGVLTSVEPERLGQKRHVIVALVLTTVASTVALIGGNDLAAGSYFVALVVAYGAFAALLVALRREGGIPAWPIVAAGGWLLIMAMVQPPIESSDVWSYASYGRMVTVHHESPWVHVPAEHPKDPYTHRIARVWRETPAVYGPGFVLPAAGVMIVAGASPTIARLGFQMLAALAVAAAMWLVGRETKWNPTSLAVLAVNPLIPICVVNSAHNDAWVGVLLLWAVLLTTRERWAWTGVVLGVAAMVKVTALLAVVALAIWAWRRAGRQAAAKVAGVAVLICSVTVIAAGGSEVVRAMRWNSWRMTRGNLWARSRGWVFGELGDAHHTDQARLATLAVILTVALAGFLVTRHRRASHPALLVGLTVIAYTLVSAYVLPWYVTWGLIPLALCPRAPTTRLLLAVGALLELAAVPGLHLLSDRSSFWSPALTSAQMVKDALPWTLAALAGAVVIVGSVRWRGATEPRRI